MSSTQLGRVTLVWKGLYSSGTTYTRLDAVSYGGSSYVALKTVTGVTPNNNGIDWLQIAAKGDKGDKGTIFTPSVSAAGVISWTNNDGQTNPTSQNIRGPQGPSTAVSLNGTTYNDVAGVVTLPDLSTKTETALKADKSTTYTKTEVDASLALKADQAKLDTTNTRVAVVDKKLDDYTAIMSQVNVNQEAKQTLTGYDKILSLPKNAANGNVGFGLQGMTAQNLVKNGDLSQGTTGWTANAGTLSVANNVLSLTGNGSTLNPFVKNTLANLTASHKMYLTFNARVTNSVCASFRLEGSNISPSIVKVDTPTQNQWYKFSTVSTVSANGDVILYAQHYYADAATANGKVMEVKEVVAIDLTALLLDSYDATMCNAAFANFFSGLRSTISRGRIKSVGKNLFDKSKQNVGKGVLVTDGSLYANPGYNSSDYILVSGAKEYSLTYYAYGSTSYGLAFYDSNKMFISGINGTAQFKKFTTPANAKFLRFAYTTASGDGSDIQLEVGSTATAYESFRESTKYINATTPLCRVPNGTQDEIRQRQDGGYELVQRCKEYTLQASDVTGIADVTNAQAVFVKKPTDFILYNNSVTSLANAQTITIPGYTPGGAYTLGLPYTHTNYSTTTYSILVPLGTYANLAAAQAALTGAKIVYQLASPVITPIDTTGALLSYPLGSVYFEPITADAGVYASGINILATSFPISSLNTLSKVDLVTGVETALDPSTAVIAGNGLSFTHSGLTNGDIVFFTYSYANLAPEGSKTVTYLDSRYVIKDSVTGKFYQWGISVANGSPNIELVEVLA